MKIKFWGTRGSIPVPGLSTVKYGGNTPCVQVISDNKEIFIIDGGTGIRALGEELLEKYPKGTTVNILISHTHWDHIQGLLFFRPFYRKNFKINLFSNAMNGMTIEDIIKAQMHPSFFPVSPDVFEAEIQYHRILPNQEYKFNKLTVQTTNSHHSAGTLCFRVNNDTSSFAYMTDNELYYNTTFELPKKDSILQNNEELIKFADSVDYLIHDTTYSLKDYKSHVGWGHSNNISAVVFAHLAKVKNFFLFHYEPLYTDTDIDRMFDETIEFLKESKYDLNCEPSYEGLELTI